MKGKVFAEKINLEATKTHKTNSETEHISVFNYKRKLNLYKEYFKSKIYFIERSAVN